MTVRELCAQEGVSLCYFDGTDWHSPGFFNPTLKLLAIDINLSEQDQKQVALHELGHIDHTENEYQNALIRCENEANRNMIHHLLVDALEELDDPSDFNYLDFMKFYNLKTTTDEVMVKEEYQALLK